MYKKHKLLHSLCNNLFLSLPLPNLSLSHKTLLSFSQKPIKTSLICLSLSLCTVKPPFSYPKLLIMHLRRLIYQFIFFGSALALGITLIFYFREFLFLFHFQLPSSSAFQSKLPLLLYLLILLLLHHRYYLPLQAKAKPSMESN